MGDAVVVPNGWWCSSSGSEHRQTMNHADAEDKMHGECYPLSHTNTVRQLCNRFCLRPFISSRLVPASQPTRRYQTYDDDRTLSVSAEYGAPVTSKQAPGG